MKVNPINQIKSDKFRRHHSNERTRSTKDSGTTFRRSEIESKIEK